MTKPAIIQENISLKELNTWKVGGEAEYFCQPQSLDELVEAYKWSVEESLQVTVLSGGSNVLISDEGVSGLVVSMRSLDQVTEDKVEDGRLFISAQAGAAKSEVLKRFLKHKLPPALFLTGLPGDIGGGVVMNAGVGESRVPREFCEITDWVEVLKPDGSIVKIDAKDIQWSYRTSQGWQPGIIVNVGMSWPMEENAEIVKLIREATKNRVARQPLNWPSCGSTFRNPPENKAGALIESCGLKSHRIGGAEVSSKHANFIVTHPEARAKDVDEMIKHIQKTVLEAEGIQLETEVKYLGNW